MEIIDSGDRNADEQRKGAGKDMELKMRTDWLVSYGKTDVSQSPWKEGAVRNELVKAGNDQAGLGCHSINI